MSDAPLGRYHFLAWARRGIAASVANPDTGTLPSRAALGVQITLSVEQDGVSRTVQPPATPVQLFGPGDVIGLDPRQVIRTEPRDHTVSFEPNYLCGIELDAPDLPWAFTPAAPAGPGLARLRPWLALVALEPDEFALPSVAPLPLPAIDVLRIAALPDLADSWNWAHAQVSGDLPLAAAMASAPGSAIARLLCPRRLDPETSYTAFLVPAFEIGRRAGLGQDVSALATADPAWTAATAAPLRLPFYYRFEFHTSDAGDFESLVRRLAPTVLPDGVGQRPLDVSVPAPHVASAGPPLGLAGALHGVGTQPTPWSDPAKAAFQADLQAFVNRPAATQDDPEHPNAGDPVVVPPIYGRWHAAVQSVDRTAPGWVNDLNLDPRDRAAAGMGTQVVQEERTALLAAAWQQVDGVRQANELLRRAQLARAALQQLQRRRLLPAAPETIVALTAPLHAKVLASPGTVLAMVRASRVPERMLSGTFRRVTRPRRRLGPAPAARPALLARVASGDVALVPPPRPPQGLVALESLARSSAPASGATPFPASFTSLSAPAAAAVPPNPGFAVAAAGVAPAAVAATGVAPSAVAATGVAPAAVAATGVAPAAGAVAAVPAPAASKREDSAQAAAFRTATANLFAVFTAAAADPPPAPVLDLAALKTTLMTRLDPAATVPRRVRSLLTFAPGFSWAAADPLEPIMAAPTFPQPMYAPLRDLSSAGLLPGAELVPPDSVGLVLADQRFIEGYLVGLNHEMARQLLWSGYPTDQRGSYFRQFWDVSGYVPQPGDPTDPGQLRDRLADIPPIHTWAKPLALGGHPNRPGAAGDVVLLVRGELFKRYPNAVVYAGKAKRDGANRVLDDTDERYPAFRGTLPGDMTFLGFNLSLDDARGGTPASPEGFFFIFQEQPAEPRFGLEPVENTSPIARWADLAWTNFGGGGAFQLPGVGLTGLTARASTIANSPWRLASQVFSQVLAGTALPDFLAPGLAPARVAIAAGADNPEDSANRWGVDSAQTAAILLRLPFRILIHAGLMLPPPA